MGASDRLHAAHLAALEGRHEEALSEYAWFHEHALEDEPALYGVRLSFALAYWAELAEAYPPARAALERIRDTKTEALLAGNGQRACFHDVESINAALGDEARTYALFSRLAAASPEFASRCADLALPSIVEVGDFRMAERFMPAPEDRVRSLATDLKADIERAAGAPVRSRRPRLRAYAHNYASEVRLLANVLEGVGKTVEAVRVQRLALELIDSPAMRRSVEQKIAELQAAATAKGR